jgi:predicted extracellular nuclease
LLYLLPASAQPVCGGHVTRSHAMQGQGLASPLASSVHTIEAIVTAEFSGHDRLDGFFVQEADEHADDDPATSEGLFVYAPGKKAPAAGERVRITGTISEHRQRTELTRIRQLTRCGKAPLPTPVRLTLPVRNALELERLEGMLVEVTGPLTVSETWELGRYNRLMLTAGDRLYQTTQLQPPGRDATMARARDDKLGRLFLDDGSRRTHPATIVYPPPALTALQPVRAGDRVTRLRGVLDQFNDDYLLQPTATPEFIAANPRPPAPAPAAATQLRVAAFNVENYFNGDGKGGDFPTPRGARDQREFRRQQQKIISALEGMSADIIGLVEMENDGYTIHSAIAGLASMLGESSGTDYAFIHPGRERLGTDAITVGLLYRPDRVRPVGRAAVLDKDADPRFSGLNRPALMQTFEQRGNGERLSIVVNHLKSKGSACSGDRDRSDGQGRCNQTRTRAARALAEWIAARPTDSKDPDVLIIGDLNAYAQEDPVQALLGAGYQDLIWRHLGGHAYTYVFKGRAGYLDHALASPSLAAQVAAVRIWHINADEPAVLGYGTARKSRRQIEELYDPGPYRSSDHDPVIVDLRLGVQAQPAR